MVDEWKVWLKRSKSNLKIAKTPKEEDICYEDLCFEAQQCAEKSLKTLLIYFNQPTPRVHSFHVLLERLETYIQIPEKIKDVVELSDYAVQARYPGDYTPLDKEEYEKAIEVAERVLNWVSEIVNR